MEDNVNGGAARIKAAMEQMNLVDAERLAWRSPMFQSQRDACLAKFGNWQEPEKLDFVKLLLANMCHQQHGSIDAFLKPMLQRDFIALLPMRGVGHIAGKILSYLDADMLLVAESVSLRWMRVIADNRLWKKLAEHKVRTEPMWRKIVQKRHWDVHLYQQRPNRRPSHRFYQALYWRVLHHVNRIESNWRTGKCVLSRIKCHSETSRGVYCVQSDADKIVSGLRDNTIRIWSRRTLRCLNTLTGHTGSVLCLQYDDRAILSGSSDSTVRVWDVVSGDEINRLTYHTEAVLHLRFKHGILVTASRDRSIVVWDMRSPTDITRRQILIGHRAAINAIDFDEEFIVSASGDRTIKVWSSVTAEFVRTLRGHRRGIACLQYRDRLVVSGSSDNTIRIWEVETGTCLRVLEGHVQLVRCLRFDKRYIVSGAYDGRIKIWDLQAALDPNSAESTLCLKTLREHTDRVFRLQFDAFEMVSSSHDDTIVIWDFHSYIPPALSSP